MTMTEKILAAHAGRESVAPGDLVQAQVDLALANDITAPLAIRELQRMGARGVWDRERVALICDHFTPNKDLASAEQVAEVRRFARNQGLEHFYESGRVGIEHVLLPEMGLVVPGDVVVGADSHTCTYGALGAFSTGLGSTDLAGVLALGEIWLRVPAAIRVYLHGRRRPWVTGKDLILYVIGRLGVDGARYQTLEFTGPAVASLSMDERFTMANMAIEAGAKNGIFPVDERTLAYVAGRGRRAPVVVESDPGAHYAAELDVDLAQVEPQVALPHLPENARPVAEVLAAEAGAGVAQAVDQVVIGSCTNGRIEDLRWAAAVLQGRQVHPRVRLLVFPGSPAVMRQALREGLLEVFLEAGAAVNTPTCGPCLGGHLGILARGERAISTTNRNFLGRMGHPESEVILASPAVAAASAVAGRLATPEDLGLDWESTWRKVRGAESLSAQEEEPAPGRQAKAQHLPLQAGEGAAAANRGAAAAGRRSAAATGEDAIPATPSALPPEHEAGSAWRVGDDVDTDVIIPARYLTTSDPKQLASHCFADLFGDFSQRVRQGDYIVAGKNFGCGSSREHAPLALKAAGVRAVIAASFARIFYRNAINIGLPILESPEAAAKVEPGDRLDIDWTAGRIHNLTRGETYASSAFPPFLMSLIEAGGLVPYVQQRLQEGGNAGHGDSSL